MTEKKYCTTCQMDKPVEGGEYRINKIKRWICQGCVNRINVSRFASKPKKEK